MSGIGVGHFVEGLLVLEVGDVFLLARESCTLESISCNIFGENLPCEKVVEMTENRNSGSRGGEEAVPFAKEFPSFA